MTLWTKATAGQSVVEAVLLLPLLLILLAGGFWAYRNLSLSGAAESAAHAHLLRTGRVLPSLASRLAKTVHPEEGAVRLERSSRPFSGTLPLFHSLSGNSVATVDVSCPRERVGAFADLPDHKVVEEAEGAVDCWGRDSRSGSTIRGTVLGIITVGTFR